MKAIRVKYLGPTSRKPSRYIATDDDGNRLMSSKHTLSPGVLEHGGSSCYEAMAVQFCKNLGWTGLLHQGGLGAGTVVFVFEDKKPIQVD